MDLISAFADQRPSLDWRAAAREGVAVACLSTEAWAAWDEDAWHLLDAAERTRVHRKRQPWDRRATAMAYAWQRLLLASVLDCPPERVPVSRDRLGAPVVPGTDIRTSLSHARGLAAIAVSARGVVGIDIEPVDRVAVMAELESRICHPAEAAALPRDVPARNLELLALWVRKEALLKAAGIGMAVEMAGFEAPPDRPVALPGGTPGLAVVRMQAVDPGCMVAVAGPDLPVQGGWRSPVR